MTHRFFFIQLLAKSDVLIENYLPGKLTTVGLDYDSLKKDFPRLIYCSISGFGQEGPSSKKAGYDLVASAIGGLMHITGPEVRGTSFFSHDLSFPFLCLVIFIQPFELVRLFQ